MTITTFHTANIDNQNIFYREAGRKDAPVLLRLHGFPSPVVSTLFAPFRELLRWEHSALSAIGA